jgi:hypothetical protein
MALLHASQFKKLDVQVGLCFIAGEGDVLTSLPEIESIHSQLKFFASGGWDLITSLASGAGGLLPKAEGFRILIRSEMRSLVRDFRASTNLDGGWEILVHGKIQPSSGGFLEKIHESIDGGDLRSRLMVLELHFSDRIEVRDSLFDRVLGKIMDSPLIPHDPIERRRQLPHAFACLGQYLEKWQPENLKGWRLELVEWFRGTIEPEVETKGRSK